MGRGQLSIFSMRLGGRFGKLDLFPLQFVSIFSSFATPLMLILLGFFGVLKLRLVLLVLIFLLEALPLSGPSSYVGRGSLSVYSMRLGGRCHDRVYHVDRADEFDATHSGFFINSSSCTLYFASGVFLSLYAMSLKESSCMGSQRQGLLLYGIVGMPLSVWALLALSPRLSLGPIGSLLTFMGFISGLWIL